jgi:hypothetical protein
MEKEVTQNEFASVLSSGILQPEPALYFNFLDTSIPFLTVYIIWYLLRLTLLPYSPSYMAFQRNELVKLTIRGLCIPLLILGVKPSDHIILQLKAQLNGIEFCMQFQI